MTTKKEFKMPLHSKFTITENGKVVGHVKVKPSGISWRPASAQKWFQLTSEDFGKLAEEHGEHKYQ